MRAVPANRYLVFAAMAMGGCSLDLLTKHWIFAKLGWPTQHENVWWLWEGFFGLQTSLNRGALFGIGQGKVWLFASFSIVAAIGILYWLFVTGAARQWLLTIALGGIMAGILGNLYDRLGLWEPPAGAVDALGQPVERLCAVRDWILFRFGDWSWPNFNIADSLLVGGAGLLFWHAACPASRNVARSTPSADRPAP